MFNINVITLLKTNRYLKNNAVKKRVSEIRKKKKVGGKRERWTDKHCLNINSNKYLQIQESMVWEQICNLIELMHHKKDICFISLKNHFLHFPFNVGRDIKRKKNLFFDNLTEKGIS